MPNLDLRVGVAGSLLLLANSCNSLHNMHCKNPSSKRCSTSCNTAIQETRDTSGNGCGSNNIRGSSALGPMFESLQWLILVPKRA